MISTQRTLLQPLPLEDAEALFSYRSLPDVYRYQCWAPKTVSDAEDFIKTYSLHSEIVEGRWRQFGIYAADDRSLLGDCGFCPQDGNQAEIGYTIAPPFQRRGLGTEVVKSLVDYLFKEVSIHKIIAKTDPENVGSIKVLENLGFRREAHLKRSVQIRGEWRDDLVYAVLRDEWMKGE